MLVRSLSVCALLMVALAPSLQADESPYQPKIAEASDEGEKGIARFQLPPGFQAELVAAEPMLANPIAFCIDERGRFFVAETFRLHDGVSDNRHHMDWLVDDIASMTIADRVKYHREKLGDEFQKWSTEHDRVKLVWDSDGDGKADRDTVFSDGYSRLEDGLGSGVLAFQGNVYFTCIPDLWLLRDEDGDGKAEIKKSLQTGYGVRTSFIGHDLHGLVMGPDGKLYFSIGDRGLNVSTPTGALVATECGSVLRCNLDGSEIEIYHTGLRNPQELAFDEWGNLFTGDNNSDSGDRARLVPIVEGADSGWRMPFQYIERPTPRGPWNEDKLWTPRHDAQPAYIVPPIKNFGDGPSGLVYNPGIGLPDAFKGHFLLADFRGGSAISGIRHFRLEPEGASFRVAEDGVFAWRIVATDIDFGYDGCLYALDWVEGWNKPGKGRIYRLFLPEQRSQNKDVAALVASGIEKKPTPELVALLSHRDMRVRLRAQWALAERGTEAVSELERLAQTGTPLQARLHAVWGLGQIERKHPGSAQVLVHLLNDSDPAVRGQSAKTLGDVRFAASKDGLLARLKDDNPRVVFLAATSLGRLGDPSVAPALIDLIARNNDADAYVRHSAIYALSLLRDEAAIDRAIAPDQPPAVRLGGLLVLRRWASPKLAMFLDPSQEGFSLPLAEEAARAVYDLPIPSAYPALAALVGRTDLSTGARRRALNAHFRLGGDDNARAVADMVGDGRESISLREEGLERLGQWSSPPPLDTYLGSYRPLAPRSAVAAEREFARVAGSVFASTNKQLRERTVQLVATLHATALDGQLIEIFRNNKEAATVRAASLASLGALKTKELPRLVEEGLADDKKTVRTEARKLLASLDPAAALPILKEVLRAGSTDEKQDAVRLLATMPGEDVDGLLAGLLDSLLSGELAAPLRLDVRLAARSRPSETLTSKLASLDSRLQSLSDPVARYADALEGGNADAGATVFFEKGSAACLKCHQVGARGGQVGPELTKIAEKNDRKALLEAIVDPNRKIAMGFDSVVLALADGRSVTGVLREENDKEVVIYDADAKRLVIPKQEIEERQRGKSAMPEDIMTKLTESELRDLIEYLVQRK